MDLSEMAARVSAGPDQFAGDEYGAAVQGLQALIDRLKSVSRTLNPQDPARPVLKARTREIENLRSRLIRSFRDLGGIDV